ncbi:GDSL-type esterase/lipase family protein [Bacteroidota bacterium]
MLTIYFWTFISCLFILIIGIMLRKNWLGKNLLRFSYVLIVLFLLEITCLVALKIKSGIWLFNEKNNLNAELYEPHPYLIGVPKQNIQLVLNGIHYSHNSLGFRGEDVILKKKSYRIIAIGGSTTYGTSVSDWQTWPYYLDSLMQGQAEVLNFGVSGYSTVEHIIQSSLIVPEYNPDLVLIHCGLNDLRSLYIDSLAADYHDFHAPNLYGALGFCPISKLPRLALVRVGVLLLQRLNLVQECRYYQICVNENKSPESMERALKLYKRNLYTLAAIYKSRGTKLIFIPQILNRESFEGDKLRWWIPYVPDDELEEVAKKYNQCMYEVADSMQVGYADNIAKMNWTSADFIDPSHLNPEANLHFAALVKDKIKLLPITAN